MSRRVNFAAAALAAVCTASPAAGTTQQPPELRVGQPVTGTLSRSDPAMRDYGHFHVYRVEVGEGERLVATLRSGAFDAYLMLLRPVGGITEQLAEDDDGGGGTDARLRLSVPAPGTYLLLAHSLGTESVGGYTLSLETAPPPRPATPQPIRVGESRDGVIVEDDPIHDDEQEEILYHLYTFDARAGQEIVIRLESDDFDAYLSFGPLVGDAIDITMRDDDGGEGTDSRIRVTIPTDGRYGVHARGLTSYTTGAYSISVAEATPQTPQPITAGQDVSGSLGTGDTDGDDKYHDLWIYRGTAGERLSVTMRSDDLDTYLVLGRMVNGAFELLASNDDADDSNSLIEHVLPATGEYVIRATSFGAGATGRYTLRLDVRR